MDALLLDKKVREFENLPANMLGLDGWLLSSLPREFRNQFLSGYERLLRVAFHPDRARFEEARRSREAFLLRVNEAIGYLQSSAEAYEVATEHVPRRANWAVKMRQRQSQLKRRTDELFEDVQKIRRERRELEVEVAQVNRARTAAAFQVAEMNLAVARMMKQAMLIVRQNSALDLNRKKLIMEVRPIDFSQIKLKAGVVLGSTDLWLIEQLSAWSGPALPPLVNSDKERRFNALLQTSDVVGREKLRCKTKRRDGNKQEVTKCEGDGTLERCVFLGSLNLLTLCEYLRMKLGYATQNAPAAKVVKILREMDVLDERRSAQEVGMDAIVLGLEDYVLPYLIVSSIGVLKEWGGKLRFVWIDAVGGFGAR